MQKAYDFWHAERELANEIERIPTQQVAASMTTENTRDAANISAHDAATAGPITEGVRNLSASQSQRETGRSRAKINSLRSKAKVSTTIHLDRDVFAFFQNESDSLQAHINHVLRAAMPAKPKKVAKTKVEPRVRRTVRKPVARKRA
jgi:uncharacterized protein (DUF4415 family)